MKKSDKNEDKLVKRLLTAQEIEAVAGGYGLGGNFRQSGGNYTQNGGGKHVQNGGGNYTQNPNAALGNTAAGFGGGN